MGGEKREERKERNEKERKEEEEEEREGLTPASICRPPSDTQIVKILIALPQRIVLSQELPSSSGCRPRLAVRVGGLCFAKK